MAGLWSRILAWLLPGRFRREAARLSVPEAGLVPLEPVPVDIDYVDVNGVPTTRRIVPTGLRIMPGWYPILVAHCRLRGAERHFRTDRIHRLALPGGEVLEVRAFFARHHGIALPDDPPPPRFWSPDGLPAPDAARDARPGGYLLACTEPALAVLVGLVRAGGPLDDAAVAVLRDYVAAEAAAFRLPCTPDDLAAVETAVRGMTPEEAALAGHLDEVNGWRLMRARRFFATALALVPEPGPRQAELLESLEIESLAEELALTDTMIDALGG
jgi:hypothetical protein